MGQGVDMVSGNYSRGAAGYYFKDGKFVHAVDEITIAGNLKDMFMNMDAIGKDIDERYKIKTGSILIPNMTVSGQLFFYILLSKKKLEILLSSL